MSAAVIVTSFSFALTNLLQIIVVSIFNKNGNIIFMLLKEDNLKISIFWQVTSGTNF